ncbi:glycosyltransferase family 2 protein [Ralstonia pickettii]|uniref:Glycosyltransferase family 2 protein n=1 Tax=Ralstonia pickettii TaxID=329 RepID=A0A2N4TWX1_RALPI|nr:glycosyltransferase family A protein [Ralstonia pickettii]PLC44197.1 glycosyltransferase family 2 protein [Ralstonia pickettii]
MITIVTPTFNRASTLPRLYESLLKQTHQDFEWVVVDDGSSDATSELIKNWQQAKAIRVQYIYQRNAGKHIALNTGVTHAQGDIIFIVDSDDAITEDAVRQISDKFSESDHAKLSGLCFRKVKFDGTLVGREIALDSIYANANDAGKMFRGDLAYIFKRTAMQGNPFPQIPGEKFIPELYIWNKISDTGNILFFPRIAIYLCDYLIDGYTSNFTATLRNNPKGFLLFYIDQIKREKSPLLKIKYAIRALQCLYFRATKLFKRKSLKN